MNYVFDYLGFLVTVSSLKMPRLKMPRIYLFFFVNYAHIIEFMKVWVTYEESKNIVYISLYVFSTDLDVMCRDFMPKSWNFWHDS